MIKTNVTIYPDKSNNLTKISIADCLQTRPIDHSKRLVSIIGKTDEATILKIDRSLKIVFALA